MGDWKKETNDWQEAARRAVDGYYACLTRNKAPETEAEVGSLLEQMKAQGQPMGTTCNKAKNIVSAALASATPTKEGGDLVHGQQIGAHAQIAGFASHQSLDGSEEAGRMARENAKKGLMEAGDNAERIAPHPTDAAAGEGA